MFSFCWLWQTANKTIHVSKLLVSFKYHKIVGFHPGQNSFLALFNFDTFFMDWKIPIFWKFRDLQSSILSSCKTLENTKEHVKIILLIFVADAYAYADADVDNDCYADADANAADMEKV